MDGVKPLFYISKKLPLRTDPEALSSIKRTGTKGTFRLG